MTEPGSGPGGIYVHVPFCSAICPYCDFAVLTAREPRRLGFAARLIREIELVARDDDDPWPVDTIYFGGGTPSILPVPAIESMLSALRSSFEVDEDAWISLEANPEDVTPDRVAAWREAGVRTLSLGVQSFDDDALRTLGRRHDAGDAARAVRDALDAGFEIVSVDLIFGLPGRTAESWDRDLERTIELGPHHVSCYQLTIHEGTVFARRAAEGRLIELSDTVQSRLFARTHDLLRAAGYDAYEVSNFARRAEHRSRHNLKYWHQRPYLGLGPSAHSFRRPRRWWNLRGLDEWELALADGRRPVEDTETLTGAQLALEALMLGLRTTDGVDLAAVERRCGVRLVRQNVGRIEALERDGLAMFDGTRLSPTTAGLAVADGLVRSLQIEVDGR